MRNFHSAVLPVLLLVRTSLDLVHVQKYAFKDVFVKQVMYEDQLVLAYYPANVQLVSVKLFLKLLNLSSSIVLPAIQLVIPFEITKDSLYLLDRLL